MRFHVSAFLSDAARILPFGQTLGKSQAVRLGCIRGGARREREVRERARIMEAGGTVPLTPGSTQRVSVLQPYCNRADTPWYTMDKVTPPDHRKPPK